MTADRQEGLSADGLARRESMLLELQQVVVRRRQWRRGVRFGVGTVLLFCFVWLLTARQAEDRLPRLAVEPPLPPPVAASPSLICPVVRDDPTIVARSLASDAELLTFLAEARRPAALVRINGRVQLLQESAAEGASTILRWGVLAPGNLLRPVRRAGGARRPSGAEEGEDAARRTMWGRSFRPHEKASEQDPRPSAIDSAGSSTTAIPLMHPAAE